MTKKCSKCKHFRPRGDFYKDKSTVTGLSAYCKKCVKGKNKAYRTGPLSEGLKARKRQSYAKRRAMDPGGTRGDWAKNHYGLTAGEREDGLIQRIQEYLEKWKRP